MNSFRAILSFSLAAILAAAPAFATKTHNTTSSSHVSGSHARSSHRSSSGSTAHGRKASRSHKLHGQQAIDAERVTQIQQALIREHYMTGEANGQWDATTQAAMQKYQSDQGWQTRLMPDSRALVKLGLGPDYSNAINAKDSSFAAPPPAPTSTIPAQQTAGFAASSGVNQ
jgi:peptidoglycan hydrolase-like protein with peptidoglycan-binding domain